MKCPHTLNYEIGMAIGDGVFCITLYDAFIYEKIGKTWHFKLGFVTMRFV